MTDRLNHHCKERNRSGAVIWLRLVQLLLSIMLLVVTLWSLGCTL